MVTARRQVPVAEVARPHGIRGELRLKLYNEQSDLLLRRPAVKLTFADGSSRDVRIDTARSVEIMDLLVTFNRTRGLTVVMVTHEQDMAAYASRTIRFRDGHVESDLRTEGVH